MINTEDLKTRHFGESHIANRHEQVNKESSSDRSKKVSPYFSKLRVSFIEGITEFGEHSLAILS